MYQEKASWGRINTYAVQCSEHYFERTTTISSDSNMHLWKIPRSPHLTFKTEVKFRQKPEANVLYNTSENVSRRWANIFWKSKWGRVTTMLRWSRWEIQPAVRRDHYVRLDGFDRFPLAPHFSFLQISAGARAHMHEHKHTGPETHTHTHTWKAQLCARRYIMLLF